MDANWRERVRQASRKEWQWLSAKDRETSRATSKLEILDSPGLAIGADNLLARRDAAGLSPREIEVLTWLALGKSGPEIGIILGIGSCTVRLHTQSVKRKLNASNIPHAVFRGLALGILRNWLSSSGSGSRNE